LVVPVRSVTCHLRHEPGARVSCVRARAPNGTGHRHAVGCPKAQGLMANIAIDIDRGKLADFCKRHHIRRLALFGSVLRPDFSSESDVDVLVEFAPGHTPGFAFFRIQEELSELIGRRVELHTPGFLSAYFRDKVRTEAQVLYAA